MELRWKTSVRGSCFHAAELLARGQGLTDARLAHALAHPARVLGQRISQSAADAPDAWRRLPLLADRIESNRELARNLLAESPRETPETIAMLADAIDGVQQAAAAAIPQLAGDLASRERPLREQWEARGPGMLHEIGRLGPDDRDVARADVLLVHPARGGGGAPHLGDDSVRLEAVLANPNPALPETVRLAWLLSQLRLDSERDAATHGRRRVPALYGLAMLPVALSAGERVDLCACDEQTVGLALRIWLDRPSEDAEAIMRWWTSFLERRPRWEAALADLLSRQ